jgi:hypothetical protein
MQLSKAAILDRPDPHTRRDGHSQKMSFSGKLVFEVITWGTYRIEATLEGNSLNGSGRPWTARIRAHSQRRRRIVVLFATSVEGGPGSGSRAVSTFGARDYQ